MGPLTLPLGACLPVPSAFATAYEVDFSKLPDQDLRVGQTNGTATKTIDGCSWEIRGGYGVGTFAVQNGNGLYLRCNNTNTNNSGANLTGGALCTKFTSLSSALNLGGWLERWTWWNFTQPHVPSSNSEMAQAGLITAIGSYAPSVLNRFNVVVGWNTGLLYSGKATYAGATDITVNQVFVTPTPNVVVVREVGFSIELYVGSMTVWGWPLPGSLTFVARFSLAGTAACPAFEDLGPWISVISGNSAGLSDLLVKKLRIQVK
jgi:hypothetical protein